MRSTWNLGQNGSGGRAVGTLSILGLVVLTFLLGWVTSGGRAGGALDSALAYDPTLGKPWTLLTYPFAPSFSSVFIFAIALWMMYQFLSDLERRLQAVGTVLFFAAVSVLGGLFYWIGATVFGGPSAILPSLNLPVEVVVFTWCLLNPTANIMLFMVVPVPTKVLMWLSVAAVVFESGYGNPAVGVVTGLVLVVTWLYVTDRIPGLRFGRVPSIADRKQAKKKSAEFNEFIGKVKDREKEREEKERLRRLFESSLDDEEKRG